MDEFHKDRTSKKDGVGRMCKSCKLEWSRLRNKRKTRDLWREGLIRKAMQRRNAELGYHIASEPLRWLENGRWLIEPWLGEILEPKPREQKLKNGNE